MGKIEAYFQEYFKIDSIDELLEQMYNFYHDCYLRIPDNQSIINYLRYVINNNVYFYKNKIKVIKINFNNIFKFKKKYYYFEDAIKNKILTYLGNKEIDVSKEIYKKFRMQSKKNNYYSDMQIQSFFNINENTFFINVLNCNFKLLITNNYQIDLNNNTLKISQQLYNQNIDSIINFLNHDSSLSNFKFILHKDNILIGYKEI